MEAKTTELIGVAISVLTICGGTFTWILGKLLKSNSNEVFITLEVANAKKEIQDIKADMKECREEINDIKYQIKK